MYSLLRNLPNIFEELWDYSIKRSKLDVCVAQEWKKAGQAESAGCYTFPDKYRWHWRQQHIALHGEKHNLNQFHN